MTSHDHALTSKSPGTIATASFTEADRIKSFAWEKVAIRLQSIDSISRTQCRQYIHSWQDVDLEAFVFTPIRSGTSIAPSSLIDAGRTEAD
jgi:hypothetical protein